MGFGFPAAIGAQIGRPNDVVVSINGDGGFQMNLQELILLKQWNLPVKVIILNNAALGMVRQWQEEFYEERYSQSLLDMNPDFVKLAESYGIRGVKVEKEEDVEKVLQEIFAYDGPVLADFRIVKKEKVLSYGSTRKRHQSNVRGEKMKRIITLTVQNRSGVLNRVTGMLQRRQFNIESISVGTTEIPGISKMTLVVEVADDQKLSNLQNN